MLSASGATIVPCICAECSRFVSSTRSEVSRTIGPVATRLVETTATVRIGSARETFFGRLKRAQSHSAVLRYIGTLEGGNARAGIKEFSRGHPIAATKGSDNIIAFTTKRYAHTPLVVQGPGAGADVTAMGVFSDILKLLNYLPH